MHIQHDACIWTHTFSVCPSVYTHTYASVCGCACMCAHAFNEHGCSQGPRAGPSLSLALGLQWRQWHYREKQSTQRQPAQSARSQTTDTQRAAFFSLNPHPCNVLSSPGQETLTGMYHPTLENGQHCPIDGDSQNALALVMNQSAYTN